MRTRESYERINLEIVFFVRSCYLWREFNASYSIHFIWCFWFVCFLHISQSKAALTSIFLMRKHEFTFAAKRLSILSISLVKTHEIDWTDFVLHFTTSTNFEGVLYIDWRHGNICCIYVDDLQSIMTDAMTQLENKNWMNETEQIRLEFSYHVLYRVFDEDIFILI